MRLNSISYWSRSLAFRLWVTSIAVLSISLTVIVSLILYMFSHSPLQMWQMKDNQDTAESVAAGLQYNPQGQPTAIQVDKRTAWLFDVASTEFMYRVLDKSGRVLLSSHSDIYHFPTEDLLSSSAVGAHRQVNFNHRPFDLYSLKIYHNERPFYVQTATSNYFGETVVDMKLDPLPNIAAITVLIAVIGFGLTFPFTIRMVLRPLNSASKAAMSITPANLTTRLGEQEMPSEIKPLIGAFNQALERLETGFSAQQQFLGSAAHELQTPLTLLRGQIELQPEINNKDLLFREIDLMARQVRQLLHLAEVSESQNYLFDKTDIIAVTHDVVDYLELKAANHQVQLQIEAPETLPPINADESALFILLKNIVENAINVTPANQEVTVVVEASAIHIQDNGPGIHHDDFPMLFKRFWRAANASTEGTGLGLAICKEIAQAHKWQITAHNTPRGAEFIIHYSAR
ncbi:signal transduction histidine kinase [Erwinia toletana]|uniref:histidine kinase n=1 Tax=Winslowiella toletana TaxID=92490 RepID=A0ABS4PBK9_9GAMM|nr:HAMP domain-containing sensor histidine kinase [Winslowiella toletana]MBP2169992.1 signal transduction histidine kinase [Winslowiella toletana]